MDACFLGGCLLLSQSITPTIMLAFALELRVDDFVGVPGPSWSGVYPMRLVLGVCRCANFSMGDKKFCG